MKKIRNSKGKKKSSFLKVILIFIILAGLGYVAYYFKIIDFKKTKKPSITIKSPEKEEKKLQIIDLDSNTRPYAVMINNVGSARKYQSGLQDAYLVYELIVEGGITRYLALFRDVKLDRIGSVRSARHYYLDYVMENDAAYVHWGFSDQAQADIKSLKIDTINGLYHEGTYFFRDRTLKVSSEHTGFTKTEMLDKAMTKLKYRKTSDKYQLLDYSIDSLDLNSVEGSKSANNLTIEYSNSLTNKYEYDVKNKVYKHIVNGSEHKDYVTGKQYTFKNIITYQVKNGTISGDYKGRQYLNNIGDGSGYFISEGYAVPIKWKKTNRSAKTKYYLQNGDELKVNDGNTFIHIQPVGKKLIIE